MTSPPFPAHEEMVAITAPGAESHDADCVLVVAQHGHDVILVRNGDRGLWELPGGVLEPGEGIREAARRELREESGQRADAMDLRGIATLRRAPDGREHRCYVFWCRISELREFSKNGETWSLRLWDRDSAEEVDGAAGTIARWVIEERARTGPP